jgi:hypothetical protein
MQQSIENTQDTRKPYVKPEITHELELETRAGSPNLPSWEEISNAED